MGHSAPFVCLVRCWLHHTGPIVVWRTGLHLLDHPSLCVGLLAMDHDWQSSGSCLSASMIQSWLPPTRHTLSKILWVRSQVGGSGPGSGSGPSAGPDRTGAGARAVWIVSVCCPGGSPGLCVYHTPQGCIRREGTSEVAPEAVRQAVGGGCQSGWGRLLSVTNAIEGGTCRQGDSGWHDCGRVLSIHTSFGTARTANSAPPIKGSSTEMICTQLATVECPKPPPYTIPHGVETCITALGTIFEYLPPLPMHPCPSTCESNALVRATVGVGTVIFWIIVLLSQGRGGAN